VALWPRPWTAQDLAKKAKKPLHEALCQFINEVLAHPFSTAFSDMKLKLSEDDEADSLKNLLDRYILADLSPDAFVHGRSLLRTYGVNMQTHMWHPDQARHGLTGWDLGQYIRAAAVFLVHKGKSKLTRYCKLLQRDPTMEKVFPRDWWLIEIFYVWIRARRHWFADITDGVGVYRVFLGIW